MATIHSRIRECRAFFCYTPVRTAAQGGRPITAGGDRLDAQRNRSATHEQRDGRCPASFPGVDCVLRPIVSHGPAAESFKKEVQADEGISCALPDGCRGQPGTPFGQEHPRAAMRPGQRGRQPVHLRDHRPGSSRHHARIRHTRRADQAPQLLALRGCHEGPEGAQNRQGETLPPGPHNTLRCGHPPRAPGGSAGAPGACL